MGECPACWDNPCQCGLEYRGWSEKRIMLHMKLLMKALADKKKVPLTSVIIEMCDNLAEEGEI